MNLIQPFVLEYQSAATVKQTGRITQATPLLEELQRPVRGLDGSPLSTD